MYHFHFSPDKSLHVGGSDGEDTRIDALRKHSANQQASELIRSKAIRSLDSEVNVHGEVMTLRRCLMELTYPLYGVDETTSSSRLFQTMDKAIKGREASSGEVFFVVFGDRAPLANSFVHILPSYVNRWISEEAMNQWFHADSIPFSDDDTTFGIDDAGNWDGTWETIDDRIHNTILNEDLGGGITIEGMPPATPLRPARHIAEEASVASFGTALGMRNVTTFGRSSNSGGQELGEASPPVENTAAALGSGGTT